MGIKKKHLYAREKTHGRLWCLSGWLLFHQNIMLYAEKQTNRYSSVLWLLQMFSDSYFFFFAFDTVVDFLHHTVINATESTAIDAFCDFVGLFYLFDVLQIKL